MRAFNYLYLPIQFIDLLVYFVGIPQGQIENSHSSATTLPTALAQFYFSSAPKLFSLRYCRSFGIERLNVALLIATIAMLLLWIVGLMAKQQKLHILFYSLSSEHGS